MSHPTSVRQVGVATERNPGYRRTMEDAHTVVDKFAGHDDCGFFAVYDGHGGKSAAEYAAGHLHKALERLLVAAGGSQQQPVIGDLLKRAYLEVDRAMLEAGVQYPGCAAASVVVRSVNGQRWLHVANCGDTHVVVIRDGMAVRLTTEHKAGVPEEDAAIKAKGGFINNGRVNGMLAVTRSLGDHAMKEFISGEPSVKEYRLLPSETHLIIACDGLWDVVTPEECVPVVASETDMARAAKELLSRALKAGTTDNVTIITIAL
eukprot:m51a1_g3883 putative ptc1p (262) ;mRNA; f:45411-46647